MELIRYIKFCPSAAGLPSFVRITVGGTINAPKRPENPRLEVYTKQLRRQ